MEKKGRNGKIEGNGKIGGNQKIGTDGKKAEMGRKCNKGDKWVNREEIGREQQRTRVKWEAN